MNKLGKYPISSLRNTTGIVWGISKDERFKPLSKNINSF